MKGGLTCLASLILLACLWGCASVPSPAQRLADAENMLELKGWLRLDIDTPPFVLRAYLPEQPPDEKQITDGKTLTVYLEGDGYAWRSRSRPSADPTPVDPVGLRMALRQPGGAAAYLARPCQFVGPGGFSGCEKAYWTSHRFSRSVVDSTNYAISELMKKTSATSLRLVGYSGGGAVAVLVAARRSDVIQLITVAGNLEHEKWTKFHSVTPLTGSLNPADFTQSLARVPQIHLVGGHDKVIPPLIAETYCQSFPGDRVPEVRTFQEYTHQCCWAEDWPEIFTALTGENNEKARRKP